MEKTKTAKAKKSPMGDNVQRIVDTYKSYFLTEGRRPASVYKFCHDLGIAEEVFYNHFGSFESIDKTIWTGFIQTTVSRLKADDTFMSFSAREKLLSFYFSLVEVFKADRSYILLTMGEHKKPELVPAFLKGFKTHFDEFVSGVIADGKLKDEIAVRPFLDSQYPRVFWVHFGTVLLFWKNDDSAGFEKTDAFIEKSVALAFDLIGKGALDSALDFAKFLYQTKNA